MRPRIAYIERLYWKKDGYAFSIEKVFRQIASLLGGDFETGFFKLPYGNSFPEILRNLAAFKAPAADIFHITGQIHYMALVLPPSKTVLTIHDLGFLTGAKGLRGLLLRKLFLEWPVRRLRYVTTISETTRDEIARETGRAAGTIEVVGNPLDPAMVSDAARPFSAGCPTILQVGITPNKNIPNLLRALRGLRCRLRVIGKPDRRLASELARSGTDHEVFFDLGPEEMRRQYEEADIVVFCSTLEGFGLPIIEAQAAGTPLITSDRSPMREVAGPGALLADPDDPSSIRAAIDRLLAEPETRARIVAAGRSNILRFAPEKIAGQYRELYLKVLREGQK